MKKQIISEEVLKMQKIAGIINENASEPVDIDYEMYTSGVYQSWVNDMFKYLEKNKPGFTEDDVLELLKGAQAGLSEVVQENIETYFRP